MIKEKINGLKENIKLKTMILMGFVMSIPSVFAYPIAFEAPDLYSVFVEHIFGGFWISVFALAAVMFIIMGVLGGLSVMTVGYHIFLFILAMAIGYTQPLIIIPLWGFLIYWAISQWIKLINNQSAY